MNVAHGTTHAHPETREFPEPPTLCRGWAAFLLSGDLLRGSRENQLKLDHEKRSTPTVPGVATTKNEKPEPMMTVQDLAGYLQVPVGTVYKWNTHGTGPEYRKIGRHVRYLRADVDHWVSQR